MSMQLSASGSCSVFPLVVMGIVFAIVIVILSTSSSPPPSLPPSPGSWTPVLVGVHGHAGLWQSCLLHWEWWRRHWVLLNSTGLRLNTMIWGCGLLWTLTRQTLTFKNHAHMHIGITYIKKINYLSPGYVVGSADIDKCGLRRLYLHHSSW